ncbi:MAG TPA: hypothetical protein VIM70_04675 [Clostridium sp.]|uniref:hypothetical protein n=1 Tax=Clostridium sp. TaxID=1506 RepID=UPI002F953B59
MLKISIMELIIRGIPEGLLVMWACCILSKTKIQFHRYLLSTIILVIGTYVVRNLPISLGINTLLILGLIIITNVRINKISVIKSIQVSVIVIIIQFTSEVINVFIIKYIFKADLIQVFSNVYSKTLYGIPSLVLFVFFTIILNKFLNKKNVVDKNNSANYSNIIK